MSPSPLHTLTPAQLACVRLVRLKGSNKRIAAELGISPNTVSQHLKEARLRLGNVSRHEAADLVAAWEQGHPQQSTSGSPQLAPQPDWGILAGPPPVAEVPSPARAVREDVLSFRPGDDPQALGLARLSGYWLRSLVDELTGPNRVRGTFAIALITVMITLVLIALANVVQVMLVTYLS